jgi:hypothetical protein
MKLEEKELTDVALYDQALAMICDFFYEGRVPENINSYYHGAATVFAAWARSIRDSVKEIEHK